MGLQNTPIYYAPSPLHGQGVFAAELIPAGAVIEICPVLLFPKSQLDHVRRTVLDDYYFDWGEDGAQYAFALGYGSLYNHSYEPNADYAMDFDSQTIDFFSLRDISPGEEILVNYNGAVDDRTPVWFEDPDFKRLT